MQKSLWSESADLPKFEKLNGDIKTDVLVIGGGICGILCTYFLKQAGVDCVLAEMRGIANAQGTTCNTTAKITSQHGLVYDCLINKFGKDTAQKYLFANCAAIENYERLCKDIPCDFRKTSAYTYSKNDRRKIEKETDAISRLGGAAEVIYDAAELPFPIAAAICVNNQAQFNPLKFLKTVSKDLKIYENTAVRDITPKYAVYDGGRIYADKFIVATHFPFINRHGGYFLKLYQHRSYMMAVENAFTCSARTLNGMYVDEAENGLSLRSAGNLLLLGGCGGRTGKNCGNWDELAEIKNTYYPDGRIKYRWAAQDCMSLDKIPYIGMYSPKTPNLYVATGFNKWGMTSSMVAAMLLSDMIIDKKNDCADIFSPSRSILKPQLFLNGFEAILNFAYPTVKRCPHLGCALKWNKAEHTWDCSCHGSRFEENGALINNPATKDADIKTKIKTKLKNKNNK